MGIHIIWKAELKNESTCPLKGAFLPKVHHRCDGDTLPKDESPWEFHAMSTVFQGRFGRSTYADSPKGRQADVEITIS